MERDIWTNSRLKAYQSCPRMEAYRYREKLALAATRPALNLGRAVHKGIELWDVEAGVNELEFDYPSNQEEADQQEMLRGTVTAMLEGYFERFEPFEQHQPELEFNIAARQQIDQPGRGGFRSSKKIRLCGKIDAIARVDGRDWLVEYKTAGQIDKGYFDRLYVDSQITFYMYAAKRLGYLPAGVIYRVLKKPSIRRRQNETVESYIARLADDYKARPDFYFYETQLYRSDDDLDEFERQLWNEIQQANRAFKKGQVFRHSYACSNYGTCPYLPLCSGEFGAENMYVYKEPFEELEGIK